MILLIEPRGRVKQGRSLYAWLRTAMLRKKNHWCLQKNACTQPLNSWIDAPSRPSIYSFCNIFLIFSRRRQQHHLAIRTYHPWTRSCTCTPQEQLVYQKLFSGVDWRTLWGHWVGPIHSIARAKIPCTMLSPYIMATEWCSQATVFLVVVRVFWILLDEDIGVEHGIIDWYNCSTILCEFTLKYLNLG